MCVCVYGEYAVVLFFFFFLGLQYVYLHYMCVQIKFWSCMCLFTEIVCSFLCGLAVVGLDTSIFLSVVCNRTFFLSSFCIVHCTLELARNHAP